MPVLKVSFRHFNSTQDISWNAYSSIRSLEGERHSHVCKALWCFGKWMCEYTTLSYSYENIRPCAVNVWNNWPKELKSVLKRDPCEQSFKEESEPYFTVQPTRQCRILCESPEQIYFLLFEMQIKKLAKDAAACLPGSNSVWLFIFGLILAFF